MRTEKEYVRCDGFCIFHCTVASALVQFFALQPTPFGYTNQRRPPVHSTSPLSTCSTCAPRSAGRAHASHASQARAPGCTYTAHLSESRTRRAARRLPPAHCLQETRRSGLATSSFNRLCATVDGSQTVRLQCLAVRGATPGGMALENDEQLRSWLASVVGLLATSLTSPTNEGRGASPPRPPPRCQ